MRYNYRLQVLRFYWCMYLLFAFLFVSAQPAHVTKMKDGVVVFTDALHTGTSHAVKIVPVTNSIIRVTVSPRGEIPEIQSLVTIPVNNSDLKWTVAPSAEKISLRTSALKVDVQLKTGAVSFFDADGRRILSEKRIHGRHFQPVIADGQPFYAAEQIFESETGEAYYGLGQHQDDVFNYKGQQVTFFQNNTEVAIPFLLSSRKYGILWDNYSLTKAGDLRPFHPLSSFRLYSVNGEEGWLTARYFNDKNNPVQPVVQRAEHVINMEFLNDSKLILPELFKPENGLVRWEGSIETGFAGNHKFRLTYGGYIKMWIDGKLVLDRWRRAWNPAPALLEIPLVKNRKTPVRIEWMPDGGESYLSIKWQEPPTQEDDQQFGFSSTVGKGIDYYFIAGSTMDEVISGYRKLTGKAPIVPRWALGFWQSRERYKSQEEILATVATFRKRKIPIDNIVLDWFYWKENEWGSQEFDPVRFPDPDSMIRALHEQYKVKLMISVWPKFYEGIKTYEDFNRRGWLYKTNIADRQKDWVGPGYVSTFYDAFNEEARKGFWDLIYRKLYKKGIDAWWMDASEPDILSNVSPAKRIQQMAGTAIGPGAAYLNAYPLQNAKGIYEGQRSADSNRRVFLLTRSGFAGSQRYAAAIWSGDIGARWHDMKAQISAGINFSMSGLPYWTMDIGGFVVEKRFEQPENEKDIEEWRELNTRWYQFGAFVPLFRAHGQYPYREIFNIAPDSHPAYQSMLWYNHLRYRLLPYHYSLAGRAYHHDYTIMRGLVMDFGSDSAVRSIGDQYLYGPSLMINPVYNYGERKREVYLPAGQGWYDLYTGKWYGGGQKLPADAPYERMPVFVKEGSIIPFGPALQYTNEKPADTLSIFIYAGKDASFELYEDEGTTYDYERGQFTVIPFHFNDRTQTLTIEKRRGSYPGMLLNRVFRFVKMSKEKPLPLDFDLKGNAVSYRGDEIIIRL